MNPSDFLPMLDKLGLACAYFLIFVIGYALYYDLFGGGKGEGK